MFERGTGTKIKYKKLVLNKFPNAYLEKRDKYFAILINNKRISDAFSSSVKAWEDAYYKMRKLKC